jgi:hypothetical protein
LRVDHRQPAGGGRSDEGQIAADAGLIETPRRPSRLFCVSSSHVDISHIEICFSDRVCVCRCSRFSDRLYPT